PDSRLTPDVAREICQRAGSKAYIAGSIANVDSEYVLDVKAVNCDTEDALAAAQARASSKAKVLDALGGAASRLRGELGESLATVKKFDVPLEKATTSSLEALKEYTAAFNDDDPALPHLLRAIELEPTFAMAYLYAGLEYIDAGQQERASAYLSKAFQLREHASGREMLDITSDYYLFATGELD